MNYLTNADYSAERLKVAAYDKARKICDKWEMAPHARENTCGNIQSDIGISIKTKKASIVKEAYRSKNHVTLTQAIPSSLLLYRLICLFPLTINTFGPEGYKVTWETGLKHKATGELLAFGEWKGGAGIYHQAYSSDVLNAEFTKDMLELLSLLVGDQCPHPYDGVLAGSVA